LNDFDGMNIPTIDSQNPTESAKTEADLRSEVRLYWSVTLIFRIDWNLLNSPDDDIYSAFL